MTKFEIQAEADLTGHRDAVYTLEIGAREGEFFSAGGDGHVVLWNVNFPANPGKVVAKFPSAIYSLVYLKDKNILLAGTRFGKLYCLNLNTNLKEKEIDLAGDVFALLHHEHKLFAACAGGWIYVIDLKHFSKIIDMRPSTENARSLAFDAENNLLYSGFSDGNIRVFDAYTLHETETPWFAHQKSVFALMFLPDGRLMSGGRDARLRLWSNKITGLAEITIPAHMFTINKLAFSPSKKYIVSTSRDKSFKIWNSETLQLLKVIERPKFASHSHSVNTALWINENLLITAGDDKTIKTWKLKMTEI